MAFLKKIKRRLNPYIENIKYAGQFIRKPMRKRILLIGTAEYNNVGDSLLTVASLRLVKDYFKSGKIIEITKYEYYRYKNTIKRCTSPKDVILFQPGGNMGNVWINEESCRREVIKEFPNNKVIVLPQTINYEDNESGRKSLKESQEIYSSHNHLVLAARERKSYEIMRTCYKKAKIIMIPDMALYLDEYRADNIRNGVLLCLRSDREKNRTDCDDKAITDALKSRDYTYTDMTCTSNPCKFNRAEYCKLKLDEFTKAEFVITDRLHGMICCALTETPCVALSNNHHKIKGVYEWIKDLEYIQYIDSMNELEAAIDKVTSATDRIYSNKKFIPYFEQIISEIENV